MILFLGPSYTAAIEGWTALGYWDVQKRWDDEIVAVSPAKSLYEPAEENLDRLEMSIEEFVSRMGSAHEARVEETSGRIGVEEHLPMLVSDANEMKAFYEEIGAYDNLTATPAPPPPVP